MKRQPTIMSATDLGASGTKVIDITETKQISRISILFSVTVATVSLMIGTLRKTVSKVEIVDGGKVLWSASGDALGGIDFYTSGKPSYTELSLTAADLLYGVIHINFGRYLYDKDLAFRPEMYDNPQLKITWDEDAANTSAVVNSFTVLADVDDNPAGGPAGGMLSVSDVKTYGMAVSSHDYTVLPVDRTIRAVYMRMFTEDHDADTLLDNVKLDVDNDSSVLLNVDGRQALQMLREYGLVTYPVVLDAAVTAKDLYLPTASQNKVAIDYDATAFVTAQSKFALAANKGAFQDIAASVDIKAETAIVSGLMPGGVMPLFLGDKNDPESWLTLPSTSTLRLDVTSSAAADVNDINEIIVESVIRY